MSTRSIVSGLAAFTVAGLLASSAQAAAITTGTYTITPVVNNSANAFHQAFTNPPTSELRSTVALNGASIVADTYTFSFDLYFVTSPEGTGTNWHTGVNYDFNPHYNINAWSGNANANVGAWNNYSATFTVTDPSGWPNTIGFYFKEYVGTGIDAYIDNISLKTSGNVELLNGGSSFTFESGSLAVTMAESVTTTAFVVAGNPSVIPEPASIALLGLASLGLISRRRRA